MRRPTVTPLWAPWRMDYILGEKDQGCLFCRVAGAGPADFRDLLVLCALPHAFVMMNKFPYNNGHIMVVPARHTADPMALTLAESQALAELLREATARVGRVLAAQGSNVGMNLGEIAGAGIVDHMHWHVVPRWSGDTNFMPVLAETRVMGEHLLATYERVLPAFAGLGQGPL